MSATDDKATGGPGDGGRDSLLRLIASPLRRLPDLGEFPLLTKELIEQANRRRTYIVRTLYAAVLFAVFGAFLYSLVASRGTPSFLSLGQGLPAFELVVGAQLLGVFLLMPALIADVVTREREHQSLDLLLITRLRPWDIVLQKLLSRFIPMATFLLLSTPLIAVAYAYGGVSAQRLWASAYIVVLTCVWVGSLCMVLCIDARKTSLAMLSCYIRLPMNILVLAILSQILGLAIYGIGALTVWAWRWTELREPPSLGGLMPWSWAGGTLVPPMLLIGGEPPPLWAAVLLTLPAWLLVLRYLRKARRMLVAVVFSASAPKPSFEIARVPEHRRDRPRSAHLPEDHPVAWFELNSRTMRQLTKVFWFACIIDLPLLIYLAESAGGLSYEAYERKQLVGFTWLVAALWLVGGVVLGLMACSAFAPERHGRTLDVLLTTPIPTRRLVQEKLAASRRCAWLLHLPLGATILCEWWFEATAFTAFGGFSPESLTHLFAALSCLAVYPWVVVWLGLWLGMRIRDRTRAAIALLLIIGAWVFVLPVVIDTALALTGVPRLLMDYGLPPGDDAEGFSYAALPPAAWLAAAAQNLHLLSPATLPLAAERGAWDDMLIGPPWLLVVLNVFVYASLALGLRQVCLRRGATYLGRIADHRDRLAPDASKCL